ncbi:SDR family oxidoreductase [Rhodobacteraceae bacterium HSP-20]|uniref:SDR family oxidoreductase n=1 Tax=Paragemmobacter amnigenus TaxID=2852097 RepID=A0ABS6J1U0_9RHOB|nr:SDR family oxidoreductase [Rhodobacter amnigenus]MBU9697382.1 SDR family oxidoreductase [Rhodobacter amnigenus]MBV4388609.1 SDR family oxidoreductase [Rhodobacter amnigenus]
MTGLRLPELQGKAVLVTGASTGIGAAVARAFAAQGARVGLHYNASEDAAKAVAYEIGAAGGECVLIRADVSDGAGARSAVEQAVAAFGRLDGLVNNAGGMVRRVAYADVSERDYDEIMDLNARSVVVASQAAIGPMKAAGGGFIINTTSVAARNGASGGAGLYGSSKAFVHNVTRGMAKELIPFGIRVNAVAPGVITTPFHERYSTEAQLQAQLATIPAGRLGVAEDCVGAFLFLACASLSGYVVGQVIEVNGGQLMP